MCVNSPNDSFCVSQGQINVLTKKIQLYPIHRIFGARLLFAFVSYQTFFPLLLAQDYKQKAAWHQQGQTRQSWLETPAGPGSSVTAQPATTSRDTCTWHKCSVLSPPSPRAAPVKPGGTRRTPRPPKFISMGKGTTHHGNSPWARMSHPDPHPLYPSFEITVSITWMSIAGEGWATESCVDPAVLSTWLSLPERLQDWAHHSHWWEQAGLTISGNQPIKQWDYLTFKSLELCFILNLVR